MTIHVPPKALDPLDALDAWFQGLGPRYLGRIGPDDPLVHGSPTSVGWRLATLGRELVIIVDADFPFGRPRIYLQSMTDRLPHVERDGKLCLRNPAVPSDPVTAVASAVGEARQLLRDISDGIEDDDFQEDFGLYWLQDASAKRRARLLVPREQGTGYGTWFETVEAVYVFESAPRAQRWWNHRYGDNLSKLRRAATIELSSLPSPALYPSSAAELWKLVEQRSIGGVDILEELVSQTPKAFPVVLLGTSPSGRRHAVVVLLSRPSDGRRKASNRREMENGYGRGRTPADILFARYTLARLKTEFLDAANSRLPYGEEQILSNARVALVGCGALGSGVAKLLAKSGVGHLVLIDPEALGWDNIRRHQLGAAHVGKAKATALSQVIARENPDIGSTAAYCTSLQQLLRTKPEAIENLDLVISCTADWAANAALDEYLTDGAERPAALYAWLEAHALASHAVLILPGASFRTGFDPAGHPRMAATASGKLAPPECGGTTSPFGAIELAHAETLTSRLALDFLRRKCLTTTWRTWLTDEISLEDAEGSWAGDWIIARGRPTAFGEVVVGPWWG